MRKALAALLMLALSAPAWAAEEKHEGKAEAKDGKAEGGAPGTNVDMPYLMAPMTGADGKLTGYAYISTRLTAGTSAATLQIRDKIAFIQDVFVRDVNGAGIAKADDPATVDREHLQARLLADAKKVMGPGKVTGISIVQLQIAPLHPVETPALHSPPPADDSQEKPAQPAKSEH